jgi:hypothetical protein
MIISTQAHLRLDTAGSGIKILPYRDISGGYVIYVTLAVPVLFNCSPMSDALPKPLMYFI